MFLLVPLSLIVVSILGILLVVLRKKNYLSKLYSLNTAGNVENSTAINFNFSWKKYGEDFFPEIKTLFNRLEIHKYKGHWLMEIEKILRRIRVIFMRIDRWSDSTIKKIRKIHINNTLNDSGRSFKSDPVESFIEPNRINKNKPESVESDTSISHIFLKNEEERLIIEIAKNPKNPKLYEELGDIYMEMSGFIDAKESYEAAIELNPQSEELKLKLSSVLEKLHSQG